MIKDKIVVMLLVVLLVIPFINAQSVQSTESSETSIPDDEQAINGEIATESEEIPAITRPITDEQNATAIDDSNEMPSTFPNSSGDIVIARFNGSIKKDHAALYVGSGKIVEADPHIPIWKSGGIIASVMNTTV